MFYLAHEVVFDGFVFFESCLHVLFHQAAGHVQFGLVGCHFQGCESIEGVSFEIHGGLEFGDVDGFDGGDLIGSEGDRFPETVGNDDHPQEPDNQTGFECRVPVIESVEQDQQAGGIGESEYQGCVSAKHQVPKGVLRGEADTHKPGNGVGCSKKEGEKKLQDREANTGCNPCSPLILVERHPFFPPECQHAQRHHQ